MSKHYENISFKLFKAVEYLGPLTNLISCLILAIVIVLVVQMSRKVHMGASDVAAKARINTLVTSSHIGVTLAFTITQFIQLFAISTQRNRMFSAFFFFGGLADIFLSVMLWFIFDNEK